MDDERTRRIENLLRSIAGTVAVAGLDSVQRLTVVELEARFETSSVLPTRNLGVRMLARRSMCFALLKDSRFRPPRVPTVYLVEEGAEEGAPHVLVVDGVRYRVVGEETIPGRGPATETTIPLESSFVIYPERRTGPGVPCTFILPPIGFPELEAEAERLGIRDVLSVSPSLASDAWVRSAFEFPPSNEFATLLVGCNPSPPQDAPG
jgi:hypothetical protein